jgi:hypothetical protein
LNRYESSYCAFEVPSTWESDSPFSFTYRIEGQGCWSASIKENWLAASSGAEFVRLQGDWLRSQEEEIVVLEERSHPVNGPGQGRFFALRLIDDEGESVKIWLIYLSLGPLVCELELSGPLQLESETDRAFSLIANSFSLRNTGFFAELERNFQPERLIDLQNPFTRQEQTNRLIFPFVCLAVVQVSGWDATEIAGGPVFRRHGAEIFVQRIQGNEGDPGNWFSSKMKQLMDEGSALLKYERGEFDSREYVAVFYEAGGATRRWRTSGIRRSIEVFVEGQQPLLWTLSAAASAIWDLRAVLAGLISSAKFIPEPDWKLLVHEDWASMILEGPWYSEGKGIYRYEGEAPILLHLRSQHLERPLADLQQPIIEALESGLPFGSLRSADELLGSWRGRDILHYTVDGRTTEGEPLSVRAIWLVNHKFLYHIFSFGPNRASIEDLMLRVIESLRF